MHSILFVMIVLGLYYAEVVAISETMVTLVSTLRQGSLCPGDGAATFTCTAIGTDLSWVVGGRTMSYNANARVGSIRSNAEGDETAILIRVDSIGGTGSGLARRMSVLSVSARPSATEALTVKCHNGSAVYAKRVTFWRRVLDAPGIPQLLSNTTGTDRISITWNISVSLFQTIDHFFIQLDRVDPMLVKNTTATLFVQGTATNHSIQFRAVDQCAQEGEALVVSVNTSPTTTTTMTVDYNSSSTSKSLGTLGTDMTLSGAYRAHSKLNSLFFLAMYYGITTK